MSVPDKGINRRTTIGMMWGRNGSATHVFDFLCALEGRLGGGAVAVAVLV